MSKLFEYFVSFHVKTDPPSSIFTNTSFTTQRRIDSLERVRLVEKVLMEKNGYELRIIFFTLLNSPEFDDDSVISGIKKELD